ncbi:MacB family efflux pump subunit [Xanthobacter dioxanivorans]|uniref:Pyoverdine export ATP-binding/permease protein PvdT n=1 Tax=Xanthobacter dioxanivorans TaxID=2528964 RepID=A0A974PU05_9HYPH|nr:MacB family efflux pump subunit [Xanthobacter dioxanivorans]QRG09792.1 MacB family efflux pump subunit [Xanthobacter dioxanivorans]
MSGAPLIQLSGIRRAFTHGAVTSEVLRGIDLTIHAGEFVAIVGQSGSGKSTLMNILGLLDHPSGGTYRFAGEDVSTLSRDGQAELRREVFGFVFQRYHLLPGVSARANAELPAIYAGVDGKARQRRATALLERLGLGGRLDHRPDQLSGGQQQRVSIARALMNGGEVILADEPTGALDSASGAAVMDLLRELAAEGHTVILITHDPAVARIARRVVEIRDGVIVRDSGNGEAVHPAPAPARRPDRHAPALFALTEALRSAFAALAGNPFRTALTLLGIVIGTASVIAMLAIGEGTRRQVLARAAATGTDWIVVMPDNDNPALPGGRMTLADAQALAQLPNVKSVNPGRWTTVTLTAGAVTLRSEAFGTSTAYPETFRWRTHRGSFFTPDDERAAAPVMVLGAAVAARLFPGVADPSGRYVLANGIPFLVTGVLEPKGPDERGMDRDDRVVLPLSTASSRLTGSTDLGGIQLTVTDTARLTQTKGHVRETLLARHRMEDFFINDMASRIAELGETQSAMAGLLAVIASVSLLVGGIGVMNIMLMSVTERTREIGIRMAVGASGRDILGQFLAEAVILAGAGGLAGLALGLAVGVGAALALDLSVVFQARAIALALAGAVGTGLLFGYMPAGRAARLDPVRALARE